MQWRIAILAVLLCAPVISKAAGLYAIEAAVNDKKFIINGEPFKAQSYCLGWEEGESVMFLDGSPYGACASAELLNLNRGEKCIVWCG